MPDNIKLTPEMLELINNFVGELSYKMAAPFVARLNALIGEQTKPPAEKAPAE